jgi:membrane associated rhomboid family serine protease
MAVAATVWTILITGPLTALASPTVRQSADVRFAVLLASAGLISCVAAAALILGRHPIVGLPGLISGVLLLAAARYAIAEVLDAASEIPVQARRVRIKARERVLP